MTEAKRDFAEYFASIMRDAGKMKKAMKAKGLFKAKAKCPECEGYLMATISRYNGHMHMHCTGSCKRTMME